MVGQLLVVDLLLELGQQVLFGLVAVLEDGLHVAAAALLQLLAERSYLFAEALVVGGGLGERGIDEGVLHGDGF